MISFDVVTSIGATNGTTMAGNHNCAGSVLLFGLLDDAGGAAVNTITFNGIPLTKIQTKNFSLRTSQGITLWQLLNPPSGTHSLQVTLFSAHLMAGIIISFKQGGDQDSAGSAAAHGSGSSPLTVSTTVVKSNCWTIGLAGAVNTLANAISAIASDKTDRLSKIYDDGASTSYAILMSDSNMVVSPGSNSMQFTSTQTGDSVLDIAAILISITEAVGSSGLFMVSD